MSCNILTSAHNTLDEYDDDYDQEEHHVQSFQSPSENRNSNGEVSTSKAVDDIIYFALFGFKIECLHPREENSWEMGLFHELDD
jgi:hypothetical protein